MSAARVPENPAELLVTRPERLQDVCHRLRAAGLLAFDTEFIRENSYQPKVCLVQVAGPDLVAMIDPLALDIAPFWELVTDEAIEKVVFAGEQDLELCFQQAGKAPRNVFDVQLAAGFVGLPYQTSYGNLVKLMLGHELAQGHAYSDWQRRPLTKAQLSYAVEDVLHLLEMKDILQQKLVAAGRLDWLREETQRYQTDDFYARPADLMYTRVKGHERLGRVELAILRELAAWREQAACEQDVPSRTAMRDECLVEIARRRPKNVPDLDRIRGLPHPDVVRYGQQILQAIRRGQDTPAAQCPAPPASYDTATNKMLADLACAAGQSICLEQDLSHRLLASQADYLELVAHLRRKQSGEAPAGAGLPKLLTGWRRQFVGEHLQALLTGHAALRIGGHPGNPHVKYE